MMITFDQKKNLRNIEQRGLPFELVTEFDFGSALFELDRRHEYKGTRVRAFGKIHDRLHVLVFTVTDAGIGVISLRKANQREVRRYEAQTKP